MPNQMPKTLIVGIIATIAILLIIFLAILKKQNI